MKSLCSNTTYLYSRKTHHLYHIEAKKSYSKDQQNLQAEQTKNVLSDRDKRSWFTRVKERIKMKSIDADLELLTENAIFLNY